MRKYAREVAFCKVYEYIMNNGYLMDADVSLFDSQNLDKDDIEYIKSTQKGIAEHFAELTTSAEKYAEGFKLDRIFRTDLAALVLAIYEIDYTDTPKAVCVNEVVEIAKKYSAEKSAGFVNGLLAAYLKGRN